MAEMKINKQDFYGENIDIVKNIKYQTLDQTKNINKDLKSWYDSIKNIPEKPLDGRALVLMTEKQKENNYQSVEKMLDKCRYHVYDIDICEETALHWAAKRGLQKIVDLLLQYNCDVNAKDHLGRTPLYYSLRSGHSLIAIQLLRHRAVPWTYNSNYKYDNLIFGQNNKVSQECRLIFRTSQKINFLAYLTPTHKQEKLWEDSQHFFEQDLEAFKRGELKIQSYF
ncbi:Ankyrin repeat-containing domain [Pseudocohnilembus persalinus]|uniref:Ankyrin repeat-containing domain n=1 Tax=Pseudocohnilembus persalinus TaxID=266149 RepID=A0A0V0QJH9_PSEPJ|nr:Ankyrin repeat-containing domain [Pseudocohnilembus persalinus]|eukprot:KRX02268.1 Ankyrin repeat-containing domain [Pseudocohnilembus persalinus]